MGNASSSTAKAAETRVDHGYLTPHGIYTGSVDWNQHIVGHLILERRLAPFYRPLEDYEESWDDETILAHRKGLDAEGEAQAAAHELHQHQQQSQSSRHGKSNPQRPTKEIQKQPTEAQIYRGAVECPICFMYYPPNINHSRCCFQAICSECFVQIKRNEPTPTHLVSEPACCPYCQQESFGVTYAPPPWRTGLVADNARPEMSKSTSSASDPARRKSFSHDSPNVVTTDQIRPDWEERLAAVKAAVARRANRRIIMRQVGDRLIPVGVTSSRTQLPEGITTVEDIEELMLMEAMRLSLIDHERSNPSNASTSNAIPTPSVPSRLTASNSPNPSPGSSPRPTDAATDEAQRRRGGNPTLSALAVPLANAGNLIAMSTAMPSSSSRDNMTPEQPSDASLSVDAGSSSAISSVRERLSSQSSHRRVDSNPPPTTTLAAAITASSTANAFLHPRTSESHPRPVTNGEQNATSTEAATGSAGEVPVEAPETHVLDPQNAPETKGHQTVVNATAPIGEESTLAH